jgi:hypothetical protein
MRSDVVDELRRIEPTLPALHREAVREAIAELLRMRRMIEVVIGAQRDPMVGLMRDMPGEF